MALNHTDEAKQFREIAPLLAAIGEPGMARDALDIAAEIEAKKPAAQPDEPTSHDEVGATGRQTGGTYTHRFRERGTATCNSYPQRMEEGNWQ